VEAAAKATAFLNREGVGNPGPDFFSTPYARASLEAAHSEALGEDRSVRLGDVLEFLRERCDPSEGVHGDGAIMSATEDFGPEQAADAVAREFGATGKGGAR
jgi:hypothetical protein